MKRVRTKRLTAYLSGGMQFASRNGADWRADLGGWIEQVLGHRVIDPVRESRILKERMKDQGYQLSGNKRVGGGWPAFFRRIVDADSRFVRDSDYIVCLWNVSAKKGAGTQGELTLARGRRIPVYLVSRTKLEDLPGWIQGCVTRHFGTFQELKMYLIQQYYRPA